MKRFDFALSVLTLSALVTGAQAEVAVIINAAAIVTPTESDVANIFLGKDKSLKGVDQKEWNDTKATFYGSLISKNEAQMKSYWARLVFTGKGRPLRSVADDAAVVAKVSSDTDAIGYVDATAVNDKVRVLFTLR